MAFGKSGRARIVGKIPSKLPFAYSTNTRRMPKGAGKAVCHLPRPTHLLIALQRTTAMFLFSFPNLL